MLRSLAEYPARQAEAAIAATAQQLVHVATGEGTNEWIGHTYGIIERYIPSQIKPMRAANQQRWRLDFTAVNHLHVPVALVSMLLAVIVFGRGLWRRPFDDLTLLAGTITFALLGNAFICAVISGPHDRYGARMAWVATFVVLILPQGALSYQAIQMICLCRDKNSTLMPLNHGSGKLDPILYFTSARRLRVQAGNLFSLYSLSPLRPQC